MFRKEQSGDSYESVQSSTSHTTQSHVTEQSSVVDNSQLLAKNKSVSFIVIGRNEGARLELCIKSIIKAVKNCGLNAEIIYVDSQSTDNSLEVANKFSLVKTFLITGIYNAAIARNIGVSESQGDTLVFLDGDMEIQSDFVELIIDKKGNLEYEFVSGNFMNYYYDENGVFLHKDFYKKIYCEQDTIQYTTGGLFAIKRKHWERVGGMKNKYKKGQDLDLGFRLAKNGIPLLRKKELMANHHTIDYKDKKRLWRSFSDGSYVYPRVVLYRDNLLNKYVLKRMLASDPTWVLLIAMIVLSILIKSFFPVLVYLVLAIFAVLYSMRKTGFKNVINRIINHILRDFFNLLALFFFHPRSKRDVKYILYQS